MHSESPNIITQQTTSEDSGQLKAESAEMLSNVPAETPQDTSPTSHESTRPIIDSAIVKREDEKKLLTVRARLSALSGQLSAWWNSKEGHPKTNILYRSNRMYRCIGTKGYADFMQSGIVRSENSKKYWDVSFNIGEPAPSYMQEESGDYILEATEDSATFEHKTNPYSFSGKPMLDIPYRSCPDGALTKDSKIRIFERTSESNTGSIYKVVLDNIGDQALTEEEAK